MQNQKTATGTDTPVILFHLAHASLMSPSRPVSLFQKKKPTFCMMVHMSVSALHVGELQNSSPPPAVGSVTGKGKDFASFYFTGVKGACVLKLSPFVGLWS